MRVVHLPANIASQASVTVRALRQLGIEARGLVVNNKAAQTADGLERYELISRRRHPVAGSWKTLLWWCAVVRAIRWADVVHHHSAAPALPGHAELRLAARLKKARLVEFWGSEIRVPSAAASDNPCLAEYYRGQPGGCADGAAKSRTIQRRFADHGYACLVPSPELVPYVARALFPSVWTSRQRVLLEDYQPQFPAPGASRPLVVHSATRPESKGTAAVLRAVEELRKQYDFRFRLIHDLPRSAALEWVRQCDIFLDQFLLGDFGLAALEAMAFGKPVVGYVKPSLVARHPPDLPLVNATADNLRDVLGRLLADGSRRHALGCKSRAYVKRHHDARAVAKQLVAIYEELLGHATRGVKRCA